MTCGRVGWSVVLLLGCSSSGDTPEDGGGTSGTSGAPGTEDSSTLGAVDESSTSGDGESSSGGAATSQGAGSTSSSSTGSTGGDVAEDCASVLQTGVTLEVDAEGPDTQIQASATFDPLSQGIWVTYSVPDGEGTFDIQVSRIGCDGAPQITPQRVNVGAGRNDIDPELARLGDDVLVVWSSDDGVSPQGNIQILAQRLDLDGVPQLDEDVIVRTDYEGEPVLGSALNPRLHVAGEDFVLVAVRGIEEASAFQAFAQPLDADAVPTQEAASPPLAVGVSHFVADVAVLDDGVLALAWEGTDADDLTLIRHGVVDRGAFSPDPPAILIPEPARGPALAVDPTGAGAYVAASVEVGGGRQIQVLRSALDSDAPATVLASGGLLHTTSIAGAPSGAGIAWYDNLAGLDNELWAAAIVDDGDTLAAGEAVQIPGAVAAPYPSTITHISEDTYFVAWSEGDSPAFRVYGHFVEL